MLDRRTLFGAAAAAVATAGMQQAKAAHRRCQNRSL